MTTEHEIPGVITPGDIAKVGMDATHERAQARDHTRADSMQPPAICIRCGTAAPGASGPVTCGNCGSSTSDPIWERLPPERLSDRIGATVVFLGMLAGSGVGVLKLLRLILDGPFTAGSAVVLSLALAALGYMISLSVYVLTDIFFGARWSFRTVDGTWSGTVYSVLGWAWDGSGWSSDQRIVAVARIAPRAAELTSTYAMRVGPRALFDALPAWQQSIQREGGTMWRPADQAAMVLFAAMAGLAARDVIHVIHGETRGWILKARRPTPASSPSWQLPQIRLRALGALGADAPWLEREIVRAIDDLTVPRSVESQPPTDERTGPYRTNSARERLIDVGSVVRAIAATTSAEDPASTLLARAAAEGSGAQMAELSAATESFLALCASHPALITALRNDITEGLGATD